MSDAKLLKDKVGATPHGVARGVSDDEGAPPFTLPALPYARTALQPFLSGEALDYHHGKHHATYVEKLNELVASTKFRGRSLEAIVRDANGPLFENAAQHWNHSFLWNCFSPNGGVGPGTTLADALGATWESFDDFKSEFTRVAVETFGSGWVWLAERQGALSVLGTKDAENPLMGGYRPLLALDVWEHAYYVDYRNDRRRYIDAFWEVVNWGFAEENLRERLAGTAGA